MAGIIEAEQAQRKKERGKQMTEENTTAIDCVMVRKIALWFENVCTSLEKGRHRNIDSDIHTLHKMLEDFKEEVLISTRQL